MKRNQIPENISVHKKRRRLWRPLKNHPRKTVILAKSLLRRTITAQSHHLAESSLPSRVITAKNIISQNPHPLTIIAAKNITSQNHCLAESSPRKKIISQQHHPLTIITHKITAPAKPSSAKNHRLSKKPLKKVNPGNPTKRSGSRHRFIPCGRLRMISMIDRKSRACKERNFFRDGYLQAGLQAV